MAATCAPRCTISLAGQDESDRKRGEGLQVRALQGSRGRFQMGNRIEGDRMPIAYKARVTRGSGNIFADLGLRDAEDHLAKARLVSELKHIIER